MERKKYPIRCEDYDLFEEVGQGVSASVYRALCIPFNEIVAIKILDFERGNLDLANISREAQTMILIDHPNVLKAHCSFVNDHSLWVVMPFMAGGSCFHILKAAYPDGFEEVVIATILREALKGLEYLHHHGHIHRDVKSGNILLDARGAIKLGDFGVSACLFDSGDRQRTRNTFVGTPCWMAPEVMEQLHGYDFKADIWSFGITALELAHGHAPFSKFPPMKVLLMTLQNAPPGLDYERDRKYSKSFKQMIAICLVKDPSKRPSAQKLLKHSFFKQAKSSDYIGRTILEGLPTLGDRIKALKIKEEDMLAQKKMPDGKKEEISQKEYKRGISGWDFNIEDLKTQASLMQDGEEAIPDKCQGFASGLGSLPEDDSMMRDNTAPLSLPEQTLNSLIGSFDGSEVELNVGPICDENGFPSHGSGIENGLREKCELDINEKHIDGISTHSSHESKMQQSHPQNVGNCNGVVASQAIDDAPSENLSKASKLPASNTDDVGEKSRWAVFQQRGRFKVTSVNVDKEKVLPSPVLQKSQSLQVISQHPAVCQPTPSDASLNLLGCSLFPQLHNMLQMNILQKDNILYFMRQLSIGDFTANHTGDVAPMPMSAIVTEKSLLEMAHEREKELLQEITDMQWRLISVQDELRRLKTKNAQETASLPREDDKK